jgi:phage baseplate assembly protein W|tara:strand:+ start:103 stop:513 length:411 start_codon:yes stop_codon:yes gene_type:complete
MPFEVKKIAPIDLQPSRAVGVKLPFTGAAVFNQTYESKDAIKTNLINYFLTYRGERYMNPTFGNGIQRELFETMTADKVKMIDTQIKKDLSYYFPRVIAHDISTTGIPDEHVVQFSLKYSVRDTNIEDEVIINFEQ